MGTELDEKEQKCAYTALLSAFRTGSFLRGCLRCDDRQECAKAVFENGERLRIDVVLQKLGQDDGWIEESVERQRGEDPFTLSYQDAYCLTRHMQSYLYETPEMDGCIGCILCRFSAECLKELKQNGRPHISGIREELGRVTGLYTDLQNPATSQLKFERWLQGA